MYDRITEKDLQRMKDELEHRKIVVRKNALKDVQEAREHGDLSENFEYKAAKQVKNQNESRVRYIERMIKTCKVISDDSKEDEVGLNDTVKVYIPEDKEETCFKVVTTVRTDSTRGYISIDSPLGKALLRHKVGDVVSVEISETYSYDVEIRSIEKTGDDGTDQLRKF